jgi:hypothetical protein
LHPKLVQKVYIRLAFPLIRGADVRLDVLFQLFIYRALFHSIQFKLVLKIGVIERMQDYSDDGVSA